MNSKDDHGIGPNPEPGSPYRRRGPSPMAFVIVLTGVAMVFAIIVAVWMYWFVGIAPA
jgi:hypothetical protein